MLKYSNVEQAESIYRLVNAINIYIYIDCWLCRLFKQKYAYQDYMKPDRLNEPTLRKFISIIWNP